MPNVVAVAVAVLVAAALLFSRDASRDRHFVLARPPSRPPYVLAAAAILPTYDGLSSHATPVAALARVAAVSSAPACDGSPARSRTLPVATVEPPENQAREC